MLANFMTKKAANAGEAKAIMSDLDRAIKRCSEVVGKEAAGDYVQAIMENVLDPQTLGYMIGYELDAEGDSRAYRAKVLTCRPWDTTIVKSGIAMELDNVEIQDGVKGEWGSRGA